MKQKLSLISSLHYLRLVYRGALLLWALVTWLCNPQFHTMTFAEGEAYFRSLFLVIWLVFTVEMIARFFPSPTESMGCQKQFLKNYIPTAVTEPDRRQLNHGVGLVLLSWTALNGAIGALHAAKLLPDGALLLIALFYSVSDMICILFFCPFQTWMMKNRCCTTCRIYNWDYLMMFTPLIFIRSLYCLSLVALAAGLLIRWEVTAARHPQRFAETCNESLRCVNCKEKLCHHKKQLHTFWRQERQRMSRLTELRK